MLLSNGDGELRPAVDYSVGTDPDAIVAGDLNGDGRLDLAIANGDNESGTVSIFQGNGDGTFRPAVDYSVGTEYVSAIMAGDFNGDGRARPRRSRLRQRSVWIGGTDPGGVSVLLGNGDGTFQPAVQYAAGTGAGSIEAGDFNGDGHLDLAVADYDGNLGTEVSVLMGNGDGTFQSARQYTVGQGPHSLVAGDSNGDGRIDLAVANTLPTTSPSSSVTATAHSNPQSTGGVSSERGGAIVAGDFTGDGRLDLAVSELNQAKTQRCLGLARQRRWHGRGPDRRRCVGAKRHCGRRLQWGRPARPRRRERLERGVYSVGQWRRYFRTRGAVRGRGTAISLVVGDFNGDGRTDLAVACGSYFSGVGSVSVLLGNGDGSFQPWVQNAVGSDPVDIVAGDFSGDGHLDLATANLVDNTIPVLLGKGDGTFQSQVIYAVGPSPQSLVQATSAARAGPTLSSQTRTECRY